MWFRLLSSRISFTVDIANPTTKFIYTYWSEFVCACICVEEPVDDRRGNLNAYPISDMKWRKRNFLLCWLVVGARFKRVFLCVYDCLESINYISITSSPSSHLLCHYSPCLPRETNTRCVRRKKKIIIIWNWINLNRIIIASSFSLSQFLFTECQFGKTLRELGSTWYADLGPPFGIMYCIKCECVPVSEYRIENTYDCNFARSNYDPHLLCVERCTGGARAKSVSQNSKYKIS